MSWRDFLGLKNGAPEMGARTAQNHMQNMQKPPQEAFLHILHTPLGRSHTPVFDPGEEANIAPISETRVAEMLQHAALDLLNERGVRIMEIQGAFVIGVWSECDTPEVREAIRTLGFDRYEVLHLDSWGPEIPQRYREHAPTCLKERSLKWSVSPEAKGQSMSDWKAERTRELFSKKQPGNRA